MTMFLDWSASSMPGEQETQDLLVNLFKGYKACKDAEFVDYIKKKEDLYEEGGEVNYQQLMDWALNKFKTRRSQSSGARELQKRKPSLPCKPKSIISWSIRRNLPIQQASPMEMGRRTSSRDSTRKARVKASQEQVTFQHG